MKKILVFMVFIALFLTACNRNEENDNDTKKFTSESALSLEGEFIEKLFPERTDEGLVKKFKTKDQLMNQLMKVSDREVAKRYVDIYYEERDGLLYIQATEGPLVIEKDDPFEFNKLNEDEYELVQDGEDTLRGKYRLTVRYKNTDKGWIIKNRIYESI